MSRRWCGVHGGYGECSPEPTDVRENATGTTLHVWVCLDCLIEMRGLPASHPRRLEMLGRMVNLAHRVDFIPIREVPHDPD